MMRTPLAPTQAVPASPASGERAPDVSCIIAAYRCDDTIGAAIDSALAQNGVEVEVIVVDDASPSGVAPAAVRRAEAGPERVRLVRRTVNGGPGAARNDALARARGRWVAVLDADDTWHPDRLATMLIRAEGNGQRTADVLVDNPLVRDLSAGSAGAEGAERTMFDPDVWAATDTIDLADFVRGNTLFETTFNYGYLKPVLRRDLVERLGLRYDEGLRIGEDFAFLADALAGGATCRAVAVSGYVYNLREGSISRVLRLDHVRAMRRGDRDLLARHTLEPAARAAFRARGRSLERAERFLVIVEAVKTRRLLLAARGALRHPGAAVLLRMPLAVRLRRLRETLVRAAAARGIGTVRSGPIA